jgi:chromate reductase, NAD(P)H dehydrogenase (quinone)
MTKKMKIIAFAASNSSRSINLQLARYAASLVEGAATEYLDLNDFEMPIFSQDREDKNGQPEQAKLFLEKISQADALIISFAEHNGTYTAAFKNLFDWCSRINTKVFQDKPTLLLSTSPGARGGATVLQQATQFLPRFGADVKAALAVPSFNQAFNQETLELEDEAIKSELLLGLKQLIGAD